MSSSEVSKDTNVLGAYKSSKFSSEDERLQSIKDSQRNWYYRNRENERLRVKAWRDKKREDERLLELQQQPQIQGPIIVIVNQGTEVPVPQDQSPITLVIQDDPETE